MSFAFNPQLINEIWSDYKYPKSQGQELSKTGYDIFDDYNFNEKSYDYNENIQGQASLGNNKPRIFQESNKHDYDMNNYNGSKNGNVFEGFQPNPMDYPSITKPDVDMYDNRPYDYRHGPFNHVHSYNRRPQHSMYEEECIEHVEHVLRCRHCYEHLRRKLNLDDDKPNDYFNTRKMNNMLDVAIMVMGGVFLLFMVDTIIGRRK